MKKTTLFLAIFQSLPALADEQLEPIIVKTERQQVYSAPKSSVYLSHEDFNKFAILSPSDVLKNQAGIQVGDARNGGGLDVNIRGIQGQSRVGVTVDGTQQALDVYRGYAGTQQRSYIDPELISEIVIQKGTNIEANIGESALGGTVAMKTLNAEDIISDGQNFGMRLTGKFWNHTTSEPKRVRNGANIGNEDEYLTHLPAQRNDGLLNGGYAQSGSMAMAYQNENWDFVGAYARTHQGNYFSGQKGYQKYQIFEDDGTTEVLESVAKAYRAGEEVLNTQMNTQSLLLKAGYRPNEAHHFGLIYNHYYGKFGEIMPSELIRFYDGQKQFPDGLNKIDRLTANYHYRPIDNNKIDFHASAWISQAKTEQISGVEAPKSQRYITDRYWIRAQNNRYGLDLSNRSELGDFGLKISASLQHERLKPQSSVSILDVDRFANRNLRDAKRLEYAFSAHLDYQPSEQFTVWAGAKYNAYKMQDFNRPATARRENKKVRVWRVDGLEDPNTGDYQSGRMYEFPDANGNFTDATNPTLNNGVIFEDEHNPTDGLNYNDFERQYGIDYASPIFTGQSDVVVGFDFADSKRLKDNGFSFNTGAKYEFLPDTFAYLSYSRGVRLPSLFETSMGTAQVQTTNGLKSERLNSWEIGLSTQKSALFQENDQFSGKIAYFDNTIKNYINRYYRPGNNGIMTFENADSYQINGIELQSAYQNQWGYIDVSATRYFKTETCDPDFAQLLRDKRGIDAPNCTPGSFGGSYANTQNPPKFALNIGSGVHLLDGKLTLGGRMRFTSAPTAKIDQDWQRSPTTPQLFYHPINVVDAFVQYRFTKNGELNFSINNIGNRYYIDPLAQSFMPAPGRTFQLGFKYQF